MTFDKTIVAPSNTTYISIWNASTNSAVAYIQANESKQLMVSGNKATFCVRYKQHFSPLKISQKQQAVNDNKEKRSVFSIRDDLLKHGDMLLYRFM
ncbi:MULTISPECIES: hypothetical protein [unclassified Paenibacillus]|uniref:hypothetical protein n=1 Tax=unclassified Paenibacillus TaxID=185978 RepID=UPI0036318BB7